jgi:catechol 2,3-dioxygenase-like lactoylglutathione lyase family enzyme
MTGPVPPAALYHLAISVADFDAQVRWYKEALGLHEDESERLYVDEPPMQVALLRADNGFCIELIQREGSQRAISHDDPVEAVLDQGYHHWALQVDDLDAAIARLERAGARRIGPRQEYRSHLVRIDFVTDPEGNMIELVQPVAEGAFVES